MSFSILSHLFHLWVSLFPLRVSLETDRARLEYQKNQSCGSLKLNHHSTLVTDSTSVCSTILSHLFHLWVSLDSVIARLEYQPNWSGWSLELTHLSTRLTASTSVSFTVLSFVFHSRETNRTSRISEKKKGWSLKGFCNYSIFSLSFFQFLSRYNSHAWSLSQGDRAGH